MLLEPIADRQPDRCLACPSTATDAFNTGNASPTSSRAEIKIESRPVRRPRRPRFEPGKGSGGLVGQLWHRLREPKGKRDFLLPNGASAEQCGDRQNDLMLVWSEDDAGIARRGSAQVATGPRLKRFQKLGRKPVSWSPGSNREPTAGIPRRQSRRSLAAESPRAQAEAILAAARQTGAPDREATALTDLGVDRPERGRRQGRHRVSGESAGDHPRARRSARTEGDVVGNLGMAMLAVRQPERARALFERRARVSPARPAIGSLRRSLWNAWESPHGTGVTSAAPSSLFDQALALARQLGDRQQEANLLWHQGIQHAELGQREQAIARAEEAVALFKTLGKPQAGSYGAYLQKFRMGLVDDPQPRWRSGWACKNRPRPTWAGRSSPA